MSRIAEIKAQIDVSKSYIRAHNYIVESLRSSIATAEEQIRRETTTLKILEQQLKEEESA